MVILGENGEREKNTRENIEAYVEEVLLDFLDEFPNQFSVTKFLYEFIKYSLEAFKKKKLLEDL